MLADLNNLNSPQQSFSRKEKTHQTSAIVTGIVDSLLVVKGSLPVGLLRGVPPACPPRNLQQLPTTLCHPSCETSVPCHVPCDPEEESVFQMREKKD